MLATPAFCRSGVQSRTCCNSVESPPSCLTPHLQSITNSSSVAATAAAAAPTVTLAAAVVVATVEVATAVVAVVVTVWASSALV